MKVLNFKVLAFIALALAAFSCGQKAETTEETSAPAAAFADGTYSIVPGSQIGWEGKKVVAGSHNGSIAVSAGSFTVQNSSLTGGSFTIDMNSITCADITEAEDNAKLVGHLKSADFFDTENHPTATFVITSAVAQESAEATHVITGNLTIKGITQEVSFPASVKQEGNDIAIKGNVVFNRAKYEVKFRSTDFPEFANIAADQVISNDIAITIDLKASM